MVGLFERGKAIVGMAHPLPLPGLPRYAGSLEAILDAVLSDASALAEGGVDALIVENFGDLPYPPGRMLLAARYDAHRRGCVKGGRATFRHCGGIWGDRGQRTEVRREG